jgi:hypothetical protein
LESFTWAVSSFKCFCALKCGKGEEIILGEIIHITKEQVVLKEDEFYFYLSRCSKNPRETLVCIKNTSSLNFVQMIKEHLQ